MNIQKKIGLSLTLLALVNVLFIGFFSNNISQNALKDRSEEYLKSIILQNKSDINTIIRVVEKNSDTLKNDIEITYNYNRDKTDETYRYVYLETIKASIRVAAELSPSKSAYLVFINSANNESKYDFVWYSDYNYDGIPEFNDDKELFYQLDIESIVNEIGTKDEVFWNTNSKVAGNLSCIRPVIIDGELIAIVGNDLNYIKLRNKLSATKYLDSGVIYLLGENGESIYHPDKEVYSELGIETLNREKINTKAIDKIENVFDYYNNSYIISTTKLSNGWFLEMSVKTDDVYEGLNQLTQIIVIMIIVAVISTILFSYFTAKVISEPYNYLTQVIKKIGLGNYNIEIAEKYFHRDDEVGILSKAIKQMVMRQNDTFNEIKIYNDNLETVISLRTDELRATNFALEESITRVEEKHLDLEITNQKLEESIAEIKRTKNRLVQAEKIVSLRNIAIGIAHNMNTPIGNAITLTSYNEKKTRDLVMLYKEGKLSKKIFSNYLSEANDISLRILDNLNNSSMIINKFKELSSSKDIGVQTPIYIKELIEIEIDLAKKEHSDISCIFTLDIEENLNIYSELYSLQKIFFELIENSYNHAFKGIESPKIFISAVSIEDKRKGILVKYHDNGNGVKSKNISELFVPLYTTSLATKYGFGLSMVYNLVNEIFEGDITVDLELEEGLGFNLKLYSKDKKIQTEGVVLNEKVD